MGAISPALSKSEPAAQSMSFEDEQLHAEYEQAKRSHTRRWTQLNKVLNANLELELSDDTYALAFKAFHWQTQKQIDLSPSDVHQAYSNALMVFGIQCLMVSFVISVMLQSSFQIILPPTAAIMGTRFVCSILMHLQVESDMRQGLRMMKLVTNQREDFSNPNAAFFVAFMQSFGGIAAEIGCMMFLGSLTSPIETIIRFIALASIAKVDDFYASALSDEIKIKRDSDPLPITVFKRELSGQKDLGAGFYAKRFVYKSLRILYASWIFYFLPYFAIFLPYIAEFQRIRYLNYETEKEFVTLSVGT